jgi:hypothetical protein
MFKNINGLPMIKDLSKVDFLRIDKEEHILKTREIKHDLKGNEQD